MAVSGGAGAAATSSTEAWGYSNSSSTSQLAGAANRSVSRGIPAASNGDSSSRLAGTASVPPVERQPAAQRGTQAQAASDLGVPPELLPQHVAIIMDGNSRWAAARGLPVAVGHRRGVQALRCTVRACQRWGVPCLTVYVRARKADGGDGREGGEGEDSPSQAGCCGSLTRPAVCSLLCP